MRDRYGRTGKEFLEELFECERCLECGGDLKEHDAVPLFDGNGIVVWFARCRASSG